MICSICGKNIDIKKEEYFLRKNLKIICQTCKKIQDSFRYFIDGKEVCKEEYDKIIKGRK